MPSLNSSIYCCALIIATPLVAEAFSTVDGSATTNTASGKTNKQQRVATVALAAVGLSSLNDDDDDTSDSTNNLFRGSLNSRQRRQTYQMHHSSSRDDFALRMQSEQSSWRDEDNLDDDIDEQHNDEDMTTATDSSSNNTRRKFLSTMLATTTAALTTATTTTTAANAYEQAYPIELTSTPYGIPETSSNSLTKLQQERLSNKKAKVAQTQNELTNDPLGLQQMLDNPKTFGLTVSGATMWGLALWLVTGSRSNPLVTPVANVLFNEKEEEWLQDRNDGYFGDLPLSLMIILSALFVCLGVLLDRVVYFLAEGDAAVSLQLAGVSVIGGAVWEVGRLAAKEKAPTRVEYERDVLLYQEFDEFALKRLIVGQGSCHRSDVISAFRRYNPKYRRADSEQYPLADIEIERILRQWNRQFGSGSEMSSAGFFSGITVDGAADAFAPR
eukprot:CAMPEP_0113382770 /NCGR_PEP_ID=MMETSP0013_2-20120614/6018_1 /TAXON_ID=2843 ORGANISM="Skeletonema costatum, Strain 1716" /NCGR_SAMPLE_ID=MMETSP0013_2 /ASSEMBLY_ACC=CAM_ASM_000158 /LENGTH=442 /DNA_ID=CAMNT_0000265297 /DNA_START=66 /DNA_END=1394 /DNA_ORIENTATION=+ /assembly_acc=CAM_ASM_000158